MCGKVGCICFWTSPCCKATQPRMRHSTMIEVHWDNCLLREMRTLRPTSVAAETPGSHKIMFVQQEVTLWICLRMVVRNQVAHILGERCSSLIHITSTSVGNPQRSLILDDLIDQLATRMPLDTLCLTIVVGMVILLVLVGIRSEELVDQSSGCAKPPPKPPCLQTAFFWAKKI